MHTVMNSTARRASLMLALALAACSSSGDTIMPERDIGEGNTYITVINDGTAGLNTLRIRTSEQDTLPLIASLDGGRAAGPYAVRTLHSAPLVHATVQGREIIANPVEGFAGFNPALVEGAYVVRIRATPNGMLDIRVGPAVQ